MIEVASFINLANLQKTYSSFDQALQIKNLNHIEQLGVIHYFKVLFELVLKILRRTLVALGKDPLNSPRAVFRDAAQNRLIEDPEKWFMFLEYRNETVHSYNELLLEKIFEMLPQFRDEVKKLIAELEKLLVLCNSFE